MPELNATPIPFDQEQADRIFRSTLKKGHWSDLFLQVQQVTSLRLEDSILKSVSQSRSAGTGVRVVDGTAAGYAYCETFDPGRIREAMEYAQYPATHTAPMVKHQDRRLSISEPDAGSMESLGHASMQARAAILHRVEQAARNASPLVRDVTATLTDAMEWTAMFHSSGEWCVDQRPMIVLSVSVQVASNGNVQFGRAGYGFRRGFDHFQVLTPENAAAEAVRKALVQLEARPAPAGRLPVVLAAGDSAVLIHESVGHPLEADFVRKQSSTYAGRLGEVVASPLCTITDDGLMAGCRGEVRVDDEIVEGQRTVLIEKGTLTGFMHDRISAEEMGVSPTGNGRRESFRHAPMPRMTTTCLEPGTDEPGELVASTRRGIYCVGFAGGQVNIASGDFVFVPDEAYLIENGSISHPVRNLTLIGNGPDILARVDRVATDFRLSTGTWTCGKGQVVPVGIGMPSIRIAEMTVGGADHVS